MTTTRRRRGTQDSESTSKCPKYVCGSTYHRPPAPPLERPPPKDREVEAKEVADEAAARAAAADRGDGGAVATNAGSARKGV